jgi:hypothetical protein
VVSHLRAQQSDDNIAVSFAYCNSRDSLKSNPTVLVGSILKQLCLLQSELHEGVEDLYNTLDKECSKHPSWKELSTLLLPVASEHRKSFLVVDGLDECDQVENFSRLLIDVGASASTTIKIFITSRPENRLLKIFRHIPSITITSGSADDMKLYIESEVNNIIQSEKLLLGDPKLKDEIIDILISKADGMYAFDSFFPRGGYTWF